MARGSIITIFGTTLAMAGCAENIAPKSPDAGEAAADDAPVSGRHTTTRNLDGTYNTVVDATSMTEWVHGDFETGAEVTMTGPWDLRFQRFHISTNGGASGNGGVEVAPVTGVAFAQMTSMPTTGWISDAPDGDDADMNAEYAFEQGDGWFDYDGTTHKLTPKPIVWAIKSNGGTAIKAEIVRYYDAAGTAGWLELHWAPLAGGH